jgi:hypothetical protein
MPAKTTKGKGTRKGQPKAAKPGFYASVLDEADKYDFELAAGVNGLDDEIALLRMQIKSLLEREPENIRYIVQATNTLIRLVKARYDISQEDRKGLKEAIGNVLKEVALPLGIGIGVTLNK